MEVEVAGGAGGGVVGESRGGVGGGGWIDGSRCNES